MEIAQESSDQTDQRSGTCTNSGRFDFDRTSMFQMAEDWRRKTGQIYLLRDCFADGMRTVMKAEAQLPTNDATRWRIRYSTDL